MSVGWPEPAAARLYAIADADVAARHGWRLPDLVRAFLAGGARVIQLRAKTIGADAFLAIARQAVSDAAAAGATLVINDRADVAAIAGAPALHVGQADIPVADVRRCFPGIRTIGLSTHSPGQFDAALATPAGYLAVGPVFGTMTKDTGYDAVGLDLVRDAREALDREVRAGKPSRPLVAIGGITLERAPLVLDAGADSVAVISDLLVGGIPEERVRAYRSVLAR